MIDASVLRALAAAGATTEMLIAAVEAAQIIEQEKLTEKRAKDAERQRKHRASLQSVTVTPRDIERHGVTECDDVPQKEKSPTPPIRKTITPNNPSDCVPLAAETAPRKARRAKARTSISENTQPSDADKLAAEKYGLGKENFRTEWRMFRNHHISKGSTMADWPAAWRQWLDHGVQFGRIAKPAAQIEASKADTDWRPILEMFCKSQTWQWGRLSPEPGAPGCKIPAEIIAEYADRMPASPLAGMGPARRLSLVPSQSERAA